LVVIFYQFFLNDEIALPNAHFAVFYAFPDQITDGLFFTTLLKIRTGGLETKNKRQKTGTPILS